ncbi:MAG TPA: hypothetical protein VFT56_16755 [Sphingomonas sp.]|nr:hypothetical protein [Sphingomonas sp.]
MTQSPVLRPWSRSGRWKGGVAFAAATCCWLAATPAHGQDASDPSQSSAAQTDTQNGVAPATPGQDQPADAATGPDAMPQQAGDAAENQSTSETDILSKNTLSLMLDARLVVANGERSFVHHGFGKTRFQGTKDGDYRARFVPVEADLVWEPRFTGSLSANVSAAYQHDHDPDFDLIEAFVNYLPQSTANVFVSARAGLMWPEISLEHSTGGAWSVVNTITPSAINSWVGEETKVAGVEGTLHVTLGQHQLLATGGVFGFNDTSGTLLSFRGWGLHDEKATAFGHFPLPPLNPFIANIQADRTRSTIDLDKKPGYYLRLDWRPPAPFDLNVFYYDNRGEPKAFFPKTLQWGWRTRFWNVGLSADLGPNTKLLAQGMSGSTIMGFKEANGQPWVHTYFRSAYVLIAQRLDDRTQVTGRAEAFGTREHGSEMSAALNDEDGWALTAAVRHSFSPNLTGFLEALNVRSRRGMRSVLGTDPFQPQTVFQASLRFRI